MDRKEWNEKFVSAMRAITDLPIQVCEEAAREATDYFEDGYDPATAADEEISYMEWD